MNVSAVIPHLPIRTDPMPNPINAPRKPVNHGLEWAAQPTLQPMKRA